jgi:hypothetical protein
MKPHLYTVHTFFLNLYGEANFAVGKPMIKELEVQAWKIQNI